VTNRKIPRTCRKSDPGRPDRSLVLSRLLAMVIDRDLTVRFTLQPLYLGEQGSGSH
jgi:hypothetical protein